jgi:flagellar biosynthesis protein FliQ
MVAALVIAGPWMLEVIMTYTRQLMEQIPSLIS